MKTSVLAISNVGATNLDKAKCITEKESCLDEEGVGVLYINVTSEEIQRKLFEADIIDKKELYEIRTMEYCILFLAI